MSAFFSHLEHSIPEEHQECLIYALILIERGFSHGVFLHSSTVKRLFAVAFSLAFKMLTDIDVMGLNSHLSKELGMSVSHFNDIETAFFMSIDFNAGITEEDFNAKVRILDQECLPLYKADQAKSVAVASKIKFGGIGGIGGKASSKEAKCVRKSS